MFIKCNAFGAFDLLLLDFKFVIGLKKNTEDVTMFYTMHTIRFIHTLVNGHARLTTPVPI